MRSSTGGGKMIGGGIGGIIIAGILWLVFGVNPMTALQTGQAVTGGGSESSTELAGQYRPRHAVCQSCTSRYRRSLATNFNEAGVLIKSHR